MQITNAGLVTVRWSVEGTEVMNTLGIAGTASTPPTAAKAAALDAAFKAAFTGGAIATMYRASTALISVGVRSYHIDNQPEVSDPGAAVGGTGTEDTLSPSLGAVVTVRTALAGKSFRGRIFVTGLTELANGGTGTMTQAASNAVQAMIDGWVAALGGQGWQLAVVSRPRPLKIVPEIRIEARDGGVTPMTSTEIRSLKWGSQRGRAHRL